MPGRVRRIVVIANLACAVALLVLGLLPELPAVATGIPDHTAHALAYAVQAGLLFALFLPSVGAGMAALLAAAIAVLYGGFVEALQLLQPARAAEILDVAANAAGAVLAASIAYLLIRLRKAGDGR